MKSNPFKLALAPLLKCKHCKKSTADPNTGLCPKCEIAKLYSDSQKED